MTFNQNRIASKLLWLGLLAGSTAFAQAPPSVLLTVGQSNVFMVDLPVQDITGTCNVQFTFPDGKQVELEVSSPQFAAQLTYTPTQQGSQTLNWEGKVKYRGLNTRMACPGSGSYLLSAAPQRSQPQQQSSGQAPVPAYTPAYTPAKPAPVQPVVARPYITSVIGWPGGKIQFFLSDGTYVRWNNAAAAADPGYPKPVTEQTWPGLGRYGHQYVAAFNSPDDRKAFFFLANGTYVQYDIAADRADGRAQPVSDATWPGLGAQAGHIVGAVRWGADKVQFFMDDGTYLRYDLRAGRADDGYPRPVNERTWPGMASHLRNVNSMFSFGSNSSKVFFFLNDGRFIRYDIPTDRADPGYPRPMDPSQFPNIHPYLRTW